MPLRYRNGGAEGISTESTSGRYRWYAAIARPVFDAGGAPLGLVGVIQDVTARRDSEARLRRSEELLRATTANTADTLVLVDADLGYASSTRVSAAWPSNRSLGGRSACCCPRRRATGVLDRLRCLLETGETATYEFESIEAGAVRYFENRAVLVRDDGIGTGISISMRDITERKRLEQEILEVSGRERQSIGRDLHDGLGQELTGVALMLRGLATQCRSAIRRRSSSVNEIVGLVNQIDRECALFGARPPAGAHRNRGAGVCAAGAGVAQPRSLRTGGEISQPKWPKS